MKTVYWTKLSLGATLIASLLGAAACSSSGADAAFGGPSATQGVRLNGSVVGAASLGGSFAAIGGGPGAASLAVATVTVSLQSNPAISTTVGADGSFTLRGLPEGSFTLVFARDGAPKGTLTFGSVQANQEITITVDLSGTAPVLLEEKRNGIGHGDVEIQGSVETALVVDPLADSRFVIDGRTVIARPGQTSIVEVGSRRDVTDVTVGRRVHVKGSWLPLEGATQPVLALELRLQGGVSPSPTPGGTPDPAACMIQGATVGAGIELQGSIASGSSSGFRLNVEGNRATGPVDVTTASAAFQCTPASGPNAPTPEQCRASVTSGARVHVSGTLSACSATSASVVASRVLVQR